MILSTSEYYPPTAWAYDNIEVNVPQLIKTFHPAESEGLRVGTEVNFLQAEEPQDKSSAIAAVTPNAGGRRRKVSAAPRGASEQVPSDAKNGACGQTASGEILSRGRGGGRPPHAAHEAFIRELVRLADEKGGLPKGRGALANRMMSWAAQNYDGKEVPGDTTIKDWLRRFDWRKQIARQTIPSRSQGDGKFSQADFDIFIRELVRLADQEGLPEERGELLKRMVEWVARNYDSDAPPDTTIQEWLQTFVGRKNKS